MSYSLCWASIYREDPISLLNPAISISQTAGDDFVDLQWTDWWLPLAHILRPHRDLLALVVRAPGQGDADGAGAELPVEHDDHDLVRGGAALLQWLICLVDQALQLLQQH